MAGLLRKTVPELWEQLLHDFSLSAEQESCIEEYIELLLRWNERFNITAITDPEKIITDHLYDSLLISRFVTFDKIHGMADIGTGGGFPGIPLKILYPEIPLVLIEVNKKKVTFLQEIIQVLDLRDCTVVDVDWRNFLRTTTYKLDLFFARASLHPDELIRMFSDQSPYKQALLIYWASASWSISPQEKCYFSREQEYDLFGKKRRFIFFKRIS